MKAGRVLRLSIGLILGTLVACSTFSRGDNLPETSGNMQRDQPMTLIFWHAWPSPDQYILVKLVDRYNHTHPQVQVILQAMSLASLTSEMRTSITSGNGPHLLLLQNHIIGELAHDESLLRLDELVQQDIIERLIPTTVQGAQVQQSDGSTALFGIPITFDTLALYYNTAIFETPLPEEIEGVRAMAHRVVEDARYPMKWGLAYTLSLDKTIGYLDAFDGHVLDTQGNLILNQEGRVGTERWLEWLLSLHQDHDILAIRDSITVSSALKSQKVFMTIDWSHTLFAYQALWGNHLGVALLPRVQATNRLPHPYVQGNVISINAKVVDQQEQQAALDFISYLLSEESQQTLLEAGKQPVLLTLDIQGTEPLDVAARIFRQQAQIGQAMPTSRVVNNIVRDELERMQLTVLRGLKTPADAVTHTDGALRERLTDGLSKEY